MTHLPLQDLIWNRACSTCPDLAYPGDHALASLLRVHGFAMNGGVLHAVECLSPEELADAKVGYRYFGIEAAVTALASAGAVLDSGEDPEIHESELDQRYSDAIPDDEFLVGIFKDHLRANPLEYAPI